MSESADPDLLVAPEDARRRVAELVEQFRRNRDQYRSAGYNETQLRLEFLNPFFEALGWDVSNRAGYAEAYKDVIHEAAVDVEGQKKAPDYCFRIGGQRKFYVEAKKPAVNVHDDPGPAYQLRRYAWSARLPLSILTDFEEFAVYECRQKPAPTDPPGLGRILFYTFDQCLEHLDKLYSLFSREAILRGSFDRFAQDQRKHRGTQEVDAAFLEEIEKWRESLARDVARHNHLSVPDLNFAVQAIIDRILFLRIAEDRGVEHENRLREVGGKPDIYPALCRLFSEADDKYNAGLFDFSAAGDSLTPGLTVSDRTLKPILTRLYYPDCPYEFSVLGADILGAVYEQFLGKVIRLTPAGYAKVEEKPEVKKAGGVYYTPTYIVDYIVQHTVGEALAEAGTPEAAAKLRILDPACGSGSFLLGAYQRLLDWHLQYYLAHDPEKQARKRQPPVVQLGENDWRLTIPERKRILLNNLYGVDIDRQAVEVTKLNLLLKCLEGVTEQTADESLRLLHERLLPNIDANIKCGNSLIGSDYFTGRMALDEEELRRVNPFDWERGFPEAMKGGGFDCVIGNPPYLGGREWTDQLSGQREYFLSHYHAVDNQFDLYALFIERSLLLLRQGGNFGYITPNTWLNNRLTRNLREFVLTHASVAEIVDYRDVRVFAAATVLPIVVILSRADSPAHDSPTRVGAALSPGAFEWHDATAQSWVADPDLVFNIVADARAVGIIGRLASEFPALDNVGMPRFGVKVYQKGKGTPPQKGPEATEHAFEADGPLSSEYRPYLLGRDIGRYKLGFANRWLRYGPHLAEPRTPEWFEGPRLLLRRIVGDRLICTYTEDDYVADQLIHTLRVCQPLVSAKYLCGVLGSALLAFFFRNRFNRNEKTFPEIRVGELRQLPIRTIDFSDPADVARHDRMVALVERMLDLHKRLPEARTPADKELLQRQIEATDREIDALVYELYGLTEEEIAVVEGGKE